MARVDIQGWVGNVVTGDGDWATLASQSTSILEDTGTTLQAELDAIQAAVITNAAGSDIAADIIAVKAETATIVADTNELQTDDIPGTLSTIAGYLDTEIAAIKVVTDALTAAGASKLAAALLGIETGAAEAGTLSTTQMTTDLGEATADHYIGAVIVWTSGVLLKQRTDITDYDGANGLLTFTAVTEAPSAGDTFVIL
jgi:hypothetical protein